MLIKNITKETLYISGVEAFRPLEHREVSEELGSTLKLCPYLQEAEEEKEEKTQKPKTK